jgi:hypothetical protein
LYHHSCIQTGAEQQETLCWAVPAAHVNGAADRRKCKHIDIDTIVRDIEHGDIFDFLRTELGQDVADALGSRHARFTSPSRFVPVRL